MEDLAGSGGEVALGGEMLWQGDVILERRHRADARLERVDPGGGGPQARQQARARRVAQRGLAMGVGEERPAPCQAVDVRRLGLRMSAQASDPIVQVIDRDEQDVGPALGGQAGRDLGYHHGPGEAET